MTRTDFGFSARLRLSGRALAKLGTALQAACKARAYSALLTRLIRGAAAPIRLRYAAR